MASRRSQPGDLRDWFRVLRHVGTAILAEDPGGTGATPVGGILTAPQFTWFYRIIARHVWRQLLFGVGVVVALRCALKNWVRWSVPALAAAFAVHVRKHRELKSGSKTPVLAMPSLAEGWTGEQKTLMTWLASRTYLLPAAEVEAVWGMGTESKQVSFTSRRYHLAFCFYAACAAFQHEPAQVGEARRMLDWLIDQILLFKSWSYVRLYWPDELDPFRCSENIMWTGHVLAMVTLYEALLGDDRFRSEIAVLDDQGRKFSTTTRDLAQHIAQLYRERPHGICCEPGLVFFMCQNHPLHGLRLEQQLHPDINFDDVFASFESYAMKYFGSSLGGVFQFLQINKVPLPMGHPSGDGWSFSYWPVWSPCPSTVQGVWYSHMRPVLDPMIADLTNDSATDPFAGPPSKGCVCLDIPRSVTAAYLFSAAAVVGDNAIAKQLHAYLRSLQQHDGSIRQGRDWAIGSTAQLLLGLSALRGASLRTVRTMAI